MSIAGGQTPGARLNTRYEVIQMEKTRIERERERIAELAESIRGAGFRVFLADSGTYGFYTNAEGSRVVSFSVLKTWSAGQSDLGGATFGGNYKTSEPRRTGNGWKFDEGRHDYAAMIEEGAPQWATKGATWRHTTMAEHLATYGKSSKYAEVTA